MNDDVLRDTDSIRHELGISEGFKLEDGCGSREVDIELLRRFQRKELDTIMTEEVSQLVSTYSDWSDAWREVLEQQAAHLGEAYFNGI